MFDPIHLEDSDVELVVQDIVNHHGFDFRSYSRESLKRRITRLIHMDKFSSFRAFRQRVSNDAVYFKHFVEQITVNVTEMFRDPSFYKTIREQILPILASAPTIRIWHAGCSTGEEVYSLAILLHEANLLHKSILFASDINTSVVRKVRAGIYPLHNMQHYSENYSLSGGIGNFSSYYTVKDDYVKFDEGLAKKILLSTHNLVSDSSFGKFHLIFCRNVMIYFDKDLQERALHRFDESLEPSGFIALGSKETIKFSTVKSRFKQWDNHEKIWQKISGH